MFSRVGAGAGAVGHAVRRRFVRRNWLVPRRVMCILFWTGVLLIFIGMVLLVTSQHKGRGFQSWGSVLLGLGLCVMLACLILCIHTYFVMSRLDNAADHELDEITKFASGGTSGIPAPSMDAVNGHKLNNSIYFQAVPPPKLAMPPRYGVTVVSTPPPTVRLYVTDRHNDNDDVDLQTSPDNPGLPKTKVNSVSSPSSDPISSGVDAAVCSGSVGSDGAVTGRPTDLNVDHSHRKCSQSNERKLSASGGDSGNVTTTSSTKPEVTTTSADVTWLADHQGKSGPLPFPPVSITFNPADDESDGGGGGMSSCEDFHQSTETVVMQDAAAAARKAAAAIRRKSVYYNAEPDPTTATSASSDADLVTLPRAKQQQRHHHHHRHHHHRHQSQREPEVTSSERHRKLAVAGDVVVHSGASSTLNVGGTSASAAAGQRNPASCRVTRSTLHSDTPGGASSQRRLTSSADTTAATVRFQTPDTLRPDVSASGLGSTASRQGTSTKQRTAVTSVNPGTSQRTAMSSANPATSTMRTYGPACVTVTPLGNVDECARFPVNVATSTTRPERSRPLDAAELLRSEYETSYGGEVNPLVLYATSGAANASGAQEVNLSKQTVYDNVQYFNM